MHHCCAALLEHISPWAAAHYCSAGKKYGWPTLIAGCSKTNAISGERSCEVDCRILPGKRPKSLKRHPLSILDVTTAGDYSIEMSGSFSSESSCDTDFYPVPTQSFIRNDPKACISPTCLRAQPIRGFSGSGHSLLWRPDGASIDDHDRIHGHNERTSIRQLTFGHQGALRCAENLLLG